MSLVYLGACASSEAEGELELPEDIPEFVETSDFERIDWDKKAVEFGVQNMAGNKNKSGVIGATMPSLDGQKWMWHLWGETENMLTVVGFHREDKTIHSVFQKSPDEWTIDLGGENNGADAHAPSSVQIAKRGEWAFLLYKDSE
ncbi:hypothetical protein [Salinibacillus kushneri]|uniref:hypothetical protein n=1 Tax=Salinibacillus kushneri TaxID=237682 RepID=UPI001FE19ECA|nr:hypothetical protein [Salinibacillus kushneri]